MESICRTAPQPLPKSIHRNCWTWRITSNFHTIFPLHSTLSIRFWCHLFIYNFAIRFIQCPTATGGDRTWLAAVLNKYVILYPIFQGREDHYGVAITGVLPWYPLAVNQKRQQTVATRGPNEPTRKTLFNFLQLKCFSKREIVWEEIVRRKGVWLLWTQ